MTGHEAPPETDGLDRALRALARHESQIVPGAHLEAALMRQWDAAHAAPRAAAWRPLRIAAPIAAGLVLTASLAQLGTTLERSATTIAPAASPTLLLVGEPLAEDEPVHIVRMRVPAAQAAEIGLATPQTAGDIDVEVLVGEDGVARAIRLGT